jgi:hypothetical protein
LSREFAIMLIPRELGTGDGFYRGVFWVEILRSACLRRQAQDDIAEQG